MLHHIYWNIPCLVIHVHSSLCSLSNFNFLLKSLVGKPNKVVEEACNIEHTPNNGTKACEEVPKRPAKKLYPLVSGHNHWLCHLTQNTQYFNSTSLSSSSMLTWPMQEDGGEPRGNIAIFIKFLERIKEEVSLNLSLLHYRNRSFVPLNCLLQQEVLNIDEFSIPTYLGQPKTVCASNAHQNGHMFSFTPHTFYRK